MTKPLFVQVLFYIPGAELLTKIRKNEIYEIWVELLLFITKNRLW